MVDYVIHIYIYIYKTNIHACERLQQRSPEPLHRAPP
jgi:hypothetical protein